jgi:LPXTG-motif cell wall-anchored protein
VNLSVKKLRRSATVLGGTFLGLGIVTAMAAPALACVPAVQPISACVNNNGTWVVNWSVTPSEDQVKGHVTEVVVNAGQLTGIVGDNGETQGTTLPAKGVQTLPADAPVAQLKISAAFDNGRKFVAGGKGEIHKPKNRCDNQPKPKPHPGHGHGTPTPKPEPQFVYDQSCTSLTVGLEVPKTWRKTETATFTPNNGSAQSVTVKPGETKTVDFPAAKGLTVKATAKGYEAQEPVSVTYKAPKDCKSSTTPAATPSTTPAALAITGSSSAPIAGGAVALVLLGGGAFFLARRRKMKFTA